MKINAVKIKAKDLKPGDLFSTASQLYWDHHKNHHSIGERVYIRTEEPTPEDQKNEKIYRINIQK